MADETTIIRKSYRIDTETDKKIKDLFKYYNVKSENELFRAIINDIHDLKENRAIVPFNAYKEEKERLEKAIYEIGRLKGIIEEKEKQLEEQKKLNQKEQKKGFWAKLFGF